MPEPSVAKSVSAVSVSEADLRLRLDLLRMEQKATERTVDAYTGAIQETEHWLRVVRGQLDAPTNT